MEERLLSVIKESLSQLWANDKILIDIKVQEECINHRFAIYFEESFRRNFDLPAFNILSVDIEYNKQNIDNKKVIDDNGHEYGIRPDLIIHQRTVQNNFAAFELKKGRPNNKDKRTLKGLLSSPYNYSFGVLISYCRDLENFITWIWKKNDNGELVKVEHLISKANQNE